LFCGADAALAGSALGAEEVLRGIDRALEEVAPAAARIGGGEPSLRRDLAAIIARLRSKGVDEVSLHTNGIVLSYPRQIERLKAAGLTRVNVSLPGCDEDTLAAMTGLDGSFDLVRAGIANALDSGLAVEIEILLTAPILPRLADALAFCRGAAVARVNLHSVAIEGRVEARIEQLVPRVSQAAAAVNEVIDDFADLSIRIGELPACLFPRHQDKLADAGDADVVSIAPPGSAVLTAQSRDRGVQPLACRDCGARRYCFGLRRRYLARFGDAELAPFTGTLEDATSGAVRRLIDSLVAGTEGEELR
jgi:MoaA/NifB/PqqE/SkfB family radical SAM enzyme